MYCRSKYKIELQITFELKNIIEIIRVTNFVIVSIVINLKFYHDKPAFSDIIRIGLNAWAVFQTACLQWICLCD